MSQVLSQKKCAQVAANYLRATRTFRSTQGISRGHLLEGLAMKFPHNRNKDGSDPSPFLVTVAAGENTPPSESTNFSTRRLR